MKKIFSSISVLFAGAALFVSCGGGGLSEDFKKEIAEFETAWGNAKNEVYALRDSVQATLTSWEGMKDEAVPDTVWNKLDEPTKSALDSIEAVCGDHTANLEKLNKEITTYTETFEADGKAWGDWKVKVEKGEIDIETAKKDMKLYKEKITVINDWVKETNTKYMAIKSACDANCAGYGAILSNAMTPAEVPAR